MNFKNLMWLAVAAFALTWASGQRNAVAADGETPGSGQPCATCGPEVVMPVAVGVVRPVWAPRCCPWRWRAWEPWVAYEPVVVARPPVCCEPAIVYPRLIRVCPTCLP